MSSNTLPPSERIDPERLTLLLEEAGWRLVGGRQGLYNRLAPPDLIDESGLRGGLVVPLDKTAPEYHQLMTAAILEASTSSNRESWIRFVEPRILADLADQFQFRKESSAPMGLIPWKLGEDLVKAARGALAAGAKAHIQKMRRFSNKLGQFSNRFLDSVLMGQTAIGSYIITAYAPTDVAIPVIGSTIAGGSVPTGRTVRGRQVTASVAEALEATVEAVDHYRSTESLSAFEEGVSRGVSYELSAALEEFAANSESSEIIIHWESAVDLFQNSTTSRFEFLGTDAQILQRAAVRLGDEQERVVRLTLIGRVHLLTKRELGAPGVFGLTTLSGAIRKARVRLRNAEEYHLAVKAHDEDLILAVVGELERDGGLNWLYNAEILSVLPSAGELRERLSETDFIQNRLAFDEIDDTPLPSVEVDRAD